MFIPKLKIENWKLKINVFWRWWLAAALLYLIFAGIVTYFYGTGFLMPLNDDTGHHIRLAKNLIDYGVFSLDGLDGQRSIISPRPTNFLTPGYAFWLAFIYIIFKSFTPAIFIGVLIFALSVPLTYFLAEKIINNKKIAFWATLIFMFEPLSIYHSGLLFTEQLFVPIFLAAAYFFIAHLKLGNKKFLAASLLLFSVSTLIRPIIFYFLPVLILIIVLKEAKISWRGALIMGLVSTVLVYSVIGVWIIRNKIVLDTWQISSNQGAILVSHYGLVARKLKKNSFDLPSFAYESNNFSTEYNNNLGKAALKELIKNKWAYLEVKFGYLPVFFLTNGYNNIFSRLTGRPENFIFLIGVLIWAVISFLGLFGLRRLFTSDRKAPVVFLVFLILYFAFVASPIVTSRYRLPLNPLIFIFAVSGFYFLRDKLKQWI